MKPIEFVEKLAAIAAAARHHPEPALAVEQLAKLLLDLTNELMPIAKKYGAILQMSGFLDDLERAANDAQAALIGPPKPTTATSDAAAAVDTGAV